MFFPEKKTFLCGRRRGKCVKAAANDIVNGLSSYSTGDGRGAQREHERKKVKIGMKQRKIKERGTGETKRWEVEREKGNISIGSIENEE